MVKMGGGHGDQPTKAQLALVLSCEGNLKKKRVRDAPMIVWKSTLLQKNVYRNGCKLIFSFGGRIQYHSYDTKISGL
jgi:hypothetical protein